MPDSSSRKPWYDYSKLLIDVTTERNKCGMSNKYGMVAVKIKIIIITMARRTI